MSDQPNPLTGADQPAGPRYLDLTPEEDEWLESYRGVLDQFVDESGIELTDETTTLEIGDAMIRWWHSVAPEDRPDPNIIVNTTGVILGDALVEACGMEWKICEDEHGTDVCVAFADEGVHTYPTHAVAKRFNDHPDGFIEDLFLAIAQSLEEEEEDSEDE